MTENSERHFERILITGVGGSGGSYLAEYVAENHPHVKIHGVARWHSTTQDNLHSISKRVELHESDLLDIASVVRVLRAVHPDAIFHLASQANVRASFDTPNAVLTNNILGTSNLLEAIRIAKVNPYFQLCSTSEVYGQVRPEDVPIREEAPMRPASPYAVSKAAQDMLGWTYFVSYGMRIVRTRMFSYVNPRRSDLFATSFARQIARIEIGLQDDLVHGNLDSVRTLVDVRDAMRAYWDALQYCEPGEAYNIGGTATMTVGEVLQQLVAMAVKPIPTRVNPSLLRPADVTLQIPNTDKFTRATSWKPKYPFGETLNHLLGYWRKQARIEASQHNSVYTGPGANEVSP